MPNSISIELLPIIPIGLFVTLLIARATLIADGLDTLYNKQKEWLTNEENTFLIYLRKNIKKIDRRSISVLWEELGKVTHVNSQMNKVKWVMTLNKRIVILDIALIVLSLPLVFLMSFFNEILLMYTVFFLLIAALDIISTGNYMNEYLWLRKEVITHE